MLVGLILGSFIDGHVYPGLTKLAENEIPPRVDGARGGPRLGIGDFRFAVGPVPLR